MNDQNSVFWQLYFAFVSRQGGVTNIRRIMAPLFDPETGDSETAQLYADADANPDEAGIVGAGFDNCGLYPPPKPVAVAPAQVPPADPTPEPAQAPAVDPTPAPAA